MKAKKRLQGIGILLLFFVVGSIIYGNTLKGEFLWDDHLLVKDNVYVTSFKHTAKVFREDFGAGSGVRYNFYRPLQIFSYQLEHSLWGLNATGYHLTNIILHVLTALALFSLIKLIFKSHMLSLVAGLLFLVHPVHTETVAYISDRGDLLSALFMLISLYLYIRCTETGKTRYYPLVCIAFICALLAKENALILPLLICIYHFSLKKKYSLLFFLPLMGIILGYILLRLTLFDSLFANISGTGNPSGRLPGFFAAFITYIRLLFAPYGLHAEYGNPHFSWHNPRVIAGIFLILVMLSYAFRVRQKRPLVTFSLLWFCTGLLPFTNVYPLPFYMAEHYVYISSIGFFLLAAKTFEFLLVRTKYRTAVISFGIVLIGIFSYLTVCQNRYWQEPLTFYARTLAFSPHNSRVWHNVADARNARGEYKQAIEAYKKSLQLESYHADTHTNLGTAYYATRQYDEAIAMYKKALSLDAEYAPAHNNLGVVYEALGRVKEAHAAYQNAITFNPYYVRAYFNRGHLYQKTNNIDAAIAEYKKALAVNPVYSEAYNNLGVAYFSLGETDAARTAYKRALEINSEFAGAYYNLGLLYAQEGNESEARRLFEKTTELDPEHVNAFYNLALLYRNAGNISSAVAAIRQAHALAPEDAGITALLKALQSP